MTDKIQVKLNTEIMLASMYNRMGKVPSPIRSPGSPRPWYLSDFLNCHGDRTVEIWIAVSCYLQCGRSGRRLNDLGKRNRSCIRRAVESMLYGCSRHDRSVLFKIKSHRQGERRSCTRSKRALEGYIVEPRFLQRHRRTVLIMGNCRSILRGVPVKDQIRSCGSRLRRRRIC